MSDINIKIEELTPEKATILLSRNHTNRTVRQDLVSKYAGAIDRNEWILNGEAIKQDKNGDLRDGQHRCLAVIKSGKPIQTVMVTGLPSESQETMDTGSARTLGDTLKLRGEKNHATLAGALKLIYSYSKVGTIYSGATKPSPTRQELLAILENRPDIRNYMHTPYGEKSKKLLTPSVASTLFYLFSLVDKEDARLFFEKLGTGAELGPGNPIWALRERLIRETNKAQGMISPTVRAALTVKAFNAWRDGKEVYTLKWTGGGGKAEIFPRINNCPIMPEIDQRSK